MLKAKPNHDRKTALLLGGGGARAAYQVGVLKAVAELTESKKNPFPIICGTSAGSINTVALAAYSDNFNEAVARVQSVWANFQIDHVFKVDAKSLALRILRWAWSNLGFGNYQKGPSSLLDNEPLRQLLKETIDTERIDAALQSSVLHGYSVTACSYTTGESTTFFEGADSIQEWQRTHRKGRRADIELDHLMASSAIPVIFPSVRVGYEHFGDGSIRQISPISPALHLGADKVLIIGLRLENPGEVPAQATPSPSLGQISGYVMDTLFLNSLRSDLENLQRVNRTLVKGQATRLSDGDEELKLIDYLMISPSEDIATIAKSYFYDLPKSFRVALKFLGMTKGNSRRLISYLMFTKRFCNELIDLGYRDAMAKKEDVIAFMEK
ncbi:MAG: patatin-like phospholipase family protein [Pseudomonadota bacterium]